MGQQRKRGGQPGNHNALRHGYYSKIFSKEEEKNDYCSAGDVQGLDEEIALLRHVIKKAAAFDDEKHLMIMVRASNALNKLIRTRFKVQVDDNRLAKSLGIVWREIAGPFGVKPEAALPVSEQLKR